MGCIPEPETNRAPLATVYHRNEHTPLIAPSCSLSSTHPPAPSATFSFCFHLQSNEQELKTQRMMLSPRALQQGWKEELDSNISQHKEWITKRKLEAVFDAGLPARELEEEVI